MFDVFGAILMDFRQDKVERLVLDGVVDSNKWFNGTFPFSRELNNPPDDEMF